MKDMPRLLGSLFDAEMKNEKSAELIRDQFVSLLEECLDKFTMIYMCIDVLDECTEDERLKLLHGLQQLPSHKFRLFFTGRTYVLETPTIRDDREIKIWLRDVSFQEIRAARNDIEAYLNKELLTFPNTSRMEKIRPHIVDAISSQSNGQYVLDPFKSLIRTNYYVDSYLHAFN